MTALYEKALWYRDRFKAMSAPEVFYRLNEAVKRHTDACVSHKSPTGDCGPFPALRGLRETLEGWKIPETLLAEWERNYRQAESGAFCLLGRQWAACAREERWHLDPVTGAFWPRERYSFGIDYRHDRTRGDVKYVWELNRLQYLQPIAALAFVRRDEALGAFCLDEIESWIDANPPWRGINWTSGIELALRAVSILVVTSLIGEYLTISQRAKIWAMLETHALWLERYPSRFSSANNHLTAEGLGLFVIGAMCPKLPRAREWKTKGWAILCDAAQTQILPDGAGAEQSISYAAITLEMLLLGLHIARGENLAIPDIFIERIARGGEYLRWFTDASGNQPRIGDDDNARVLGAYMPNENYARSILACVAAVTNRSDLVPPHFEPHFRQALFGFPPAPAPGPTGVKCFEQGGYTIGRHRMNGHEVLLAFDHGYLGYLSIAAHGHADALALWLHIDGQPVFADAGTWLYHSGGAGRDYFRGTSAHNTLCLEKTGASLPAGNFNWSHKANARVRASDFGADKWWIEAEHDGYLEKFGVLHRRRLSTLPETGFSVTDELIGDAAHEVEIGFLLHPDLSAVMEGEDIVVRKADTPLLRIINEGPLTPAIGAPDTPKGGWYSASFGDRQAATRVLFTGTLAPGRQSLLHVAIC